MKLMLRLSTTAIISLALLNIANAQSSKKAELAEIVKKVIDSKDYIFAPRYANSNGGSFDVASNYTIKITKDSVSVYLPYYGSSQGQAPGADLANDIINFTWTKFNYTANQDKKGNYDILITPTSQQDGGNRNTKSLRLKVSLDGSASLSVISINRSPISFDGSIGNNN